MNQDLFYIADGTSLAEYLVDRLDSIEVEYDLDERYMDDVRAVLPIVAVTITRADNIWQFHIYIDDFRCPPHQNLTTVIADVPSLFIASVRTSTFFDPENIYNVCEFYVIDDNAEPTCFMEERLLGIQNGRPVYRPFYVLNQNDRLDRGLKWPFTKILNRCTKPLR